MSALVFTHLATAAAATAIAIVAFARGGRSPLLTRVLIAALSVAAWNAAHGLLVATGDLSWRILAPALGPLPLAAFTLLALRVGWPELRPARLWPGLIVVAALGFSLFTLSALVLDGPRRFVLSPSWNLGLVSTALPCLLLSGLALVHGARHPAVERRRLSRVLLLAGVVGFAGGLSEVLPPANPLGLSSLAMLAAVILATAGIASRRGIEESLALKEVLAALGVVSAVVVAAALAVARAPGQPALTAVALSAAGLVAFAAYRTVRRRWQTRLEQAARLAALGKATSVLAHEVRNPLTTVQGVVDILEVELATQPDHAGGPYLVLVRAELQRVLTLIDDCLSYASAPAPTPEQYDLCRLLDQVVERARLRFAQAVITIEPALDAPIATRGDSAMVTRLVENLVVNACQAAEPGEVRLALVEVSDRRLRLAVSDRGPGVKPEHREQIFEPFFTTKVRGGGLGLAIVREIARRHGGDVRVIDAPGGGARFEVWWDRWLPFAADGVEAT